MVAPLVGAAAAAAAKAIAKKVATDAAKKATTKKIAESLKKSGIQKLEKIGKTNSEANISFALRHGKITKQEAAALDPKNFKILLNPKVVSSKTITLKPNK